MAQEFGTAPMSAPVFAIDTHALYWHLTNAPNLSPKARQVFAEAQKGLAILAIPHVVLAEFFYLLQKQGKANLFKTFIDSAELSPVYTLEAVTLADLRHLPSFSEIPEMHDRLIAIVAARLNATLVTKDPALHASPHVQWLW
jgi:PIN domain nuclease of toxin-antitoxin system